MVRLYKKGLFCLLLITYQQLLIGISSLANNDPYPIYTTFYDPYMMIWTKEYLKGCHDECFCFERVSFSISPFTQKARRGRTFAKEEVNLGDIAGRWNMLALLYGPLPGQTSDPTQPLTDFCTKMNINDFNNTQLGTAKLHIFSDFFAENQPFNPDARIEFSESNTLTSPYILTSTAGDTLGFFSVPLKYRKVGVRGEFNLHVTQDLGITVQSGIAEIRQTLTEFISLTNLDACPCPNDVCDDFAGIEVTINQDNSQPFDNNPCRLIPIYDSPFSLPTSLFTTCSTGDHNNTECTTPLIQIQNQLMDQYKARLLFKQIGLDDCNFEKTSFEDIRFIAWWRHIFEVNRFADHCQWPWFFITPALSFNFIIPTSHRKDRSLLFSVPFGNDGHWSVGFDAQMYIDFVETVMISFGCGMNYFFPTDVKCYRLPTDHDQKGVFPFATKVQVKPGLNFNCSASLSAYHFLSYLSAYAEWVLVKHEHDELKLKNPADKATWTKQLIQQAECITKFASNVINAGLYYDISPNITLAAGAQFPIAQRNAYKSTTWMATFAATF